MDVIREIENLRKNKAILKGYEMNLQVLENELRGFNKLIKFDENEVIEGMTHRQANYESLPANVHLTDKTPEIAIEYKSKVIQKQNIAEIKENIENVKSKIFSLDMKVKYLEEVVLGCLDTDELFIIKGLHVESPKWSWETVIKNYPINFPNQTDGVRTLQNKRKQAIEKINHVIKETHSCIIWD